MQVNDVSSDALAPHVTKSTVMLLAGSNFIDRTPKGWDTHYNAYTIATYAAHL